MALLFAEHGVHVLLNDPSEENVNELLSKAKEDGIESRLSKHLDYADLCKNLDSPKVFIFSLPHGTVGDSVVDGLKPYLSQGNVHFRSRSEWLVKDCVPRGPLLRPTEKRRPHPRRLQRALGEHAKKAR